MSDSNDSDRAEPGRGAQYTEPLRIIGAEEAGSLAGLSGDEAEDAEDVARVLETASPKPSRRAVFESVPDLPREDDVDDVSPWAAGVARRRREDVSVTPGPADSGPVDDGADITVIGDVGDSRPRLIASVPDADDVDLDLASHELELPHWTAPATGQLPSVLADESRRDETWSTFATSPRWRDDSSAGWDEDLPDVTDLAHDEPPIGALAERERPAIDDFFAFDDLDDDEPAPKRVRPRAGRRRPDRSQATGEERAATDPTRPVRPAAPAGRNIPVAVAIGVGLAALAIALFRMGPGPTMGFVAVLLGIGAAEFFDATRKAAFRPATLLGLVAAVGLPLGVYWRGEVAYPIVGGLTLVAALLWFLFGADHEQVTADLGVTLLGVAYVGFLGSFAALILRTPSVDTTRVLLGAVVPVVANDVFAYTVGRNAGRTKLMVHISPNKTVEGFIGGAFGSVIASVLFNQVFGANPWQGLGPAVMLGLLVAIMGPMGDLAESMIKRDLGIKDMGTILLGHGGVLDRFDAMLFVLPGVWFLARVLGILPQ
jgi:phosphatidate cytidylyltransferase